MEPGKLAAGLFDELAEATRDGVGITRASYGEGEAFAHGAVARAARTLGLEVETDPACNTYMTLPGSDRAALPVIIGSHLDSVPDGGNFDGAAGVVAGLAAIASLQESGTTPGRDIRVMGIRAEESAWFGTSYIGSRAALGALPPGAMETARRADTGRTLAEHIREAGGDPDALDPPFLEAARLHAFLEVHIEQGPVLVEQDLPVGVVTGIRGNRRLPAARCLGAYSHCGGMPRRSRQDAVMAVMDLIAWLDRLWDQREASGEDFAFTVGKLSTDPERHAMTIVPGECRFSLDMRSLDGAFLDDLEGRVAEAAREIEARRGVTFELGAATRAAPGALDESIRAGLLECARSLDIPHNEMASGASHDSAAFAAAGVPTAMLFVRNPHGSHNPDEAMELDDFMAAVNILTRWLATEGARA